MTDHTGQAPTSQPPPAGGSDQPVATTFEREYVERLRSENAQRRAENRDLRQQLAGVEQALNQLGIAPGDDARARQQIQTIADALNRVSTLEEQARQSAVNAAVIAEAARQGIADPEDALRLADLSGVSLAPDGAISGAAEAVRALAASKPYLLSARGKFPPNLGPTNPAGAGKAGPSETIRSRLTGQGNTFGG